MTLETLVNARKIKIDILHSNNVSRKKNANNNKNKKKCNQLSKFNNSSRVIETRSELKIDIE